MRRWKGSKSAKQQSLVIAKKARPALMMALEPRMMFDAAAVVTAEAAHADHTDTSSTSQPAGIVFVDSRVKDSDALLEDVAPGTQVVRLDAREDGLRQIASYLSAHPGAGSVQIIAEGYEGDLWLGTTYLSADNVAGHATTLAQIGAGMQVGGDILIFACSTAAGERGSDLLTSLATLTGRDVAASDDRTGARGDWDLEIVKGTVESSSALSFSATDSYAYDLATLTVTSNADSGQGTLRQALSDAADADTITFNSGMTISLTTVTQGNMLAISNKSLTIDGDLDNDGSADVTLDAQYNGAVLSIIGGTVTLQGLVLTRGLIAGDGGGSNTGLFGGDALGAGLNVGGSGTRVTLLDSTISANRAAGGGGRGGYGDAYNYGYGGGGGGGGGTAGFGGGYGGDSGPSLGGAPSGGSGGTGGINGDFTAYAAQGGSTLGGAGGGSAAELVGGGAGGTAGPGAGSSIGGGGGGSGVFTPTSYGYGGRGGRAAGALYVGAGATVYIARSTVSDNWGAGGGGGGSYTAMGGDGGSGTGGILVLGTLKYQSSTTTFASNYGAGGSPGLGDSLAPAAASGASTNDIDSTNATLLDANWSPDTIAPAVSSVSVPSNGTYVAGQSLDFTVNFDESITVDTTGGTPRLALTLDTGTVYATYVSGSGTTALVFSYTVMSEELDTDGISVDGLEAGEATLRDAAGNDADLTLNNVGSTTGVLVDAVPPLAASISRVDAMTSNATSVQYTVTFTESVTGVDVTDFALYSPDTVAGTIDSVSGSGTTYTVTVNNITGDGVLGLDLNESGTGISDAAGNAIDGGFFSEDVYIFDHTAPSVTSVSVPADSTYTAGQNLELTVNFDEDVSVDTTGGTPRLALTLDTGGTVYASYVSGSGTATLTFSYTVMSGELDSDGITVSSLEADGALLTDAVGNDATLTLNGVGDTTGVLVDAVVPSVTSIVRVDAATTNATSVQYTVTFSEDVTGVDVADFALTATGTAAGTIASISGSGTTYTVTVNSITGDGTLRLDLNSSGTEIIDGAGNAIDGGFTAGEVYTFDSTAPSVTSVSVPASGTYAAGESLDFTVNFDESITVDTTGGTPRLALTLGTGGTVYASYVSGSGTGALTFSYTLQGVELDSDGVSVGSLEANGGTLSDAVGNVADLTLNGVGDTTGVLVDAVAPSVTSIVRVDTATSNASSVQYTVTFSESVTGVDVADFVLTSAGTVAGTIASISGSGTTYTVTVNSLTGDGTLRLDLASGNTGISDAAGNAIGSGFTGGEVYTFDHTAPSVISVSVPASGTYAAGQNLELTVNFDEDVSVDTTGGTPRLALTLDTGGTVYASYVSGSGTATLTFSYTVMSGELDSDGITVSSLEADGALLTDAVGNDANLALNGVGDTTGVLVDAVVPSVTSIVRVDAATTNATSVQYTVTFSEDVTGVDVADFALTATGTAAGTIASISGSGTTYTVTVNSLTGDGTLRLDLASGTTGISDAAGNAIGSGFVGGEVYTFDHTVPSVTSVSVPVSSTYAAGESLDFTVNFDESITVDTTGGTPRLALMLDTGGTVYASYVSGSGTGALTFSYTLQSGELDSDGISVGSLDANGGRLSDAVGNDADLTLNNISSTTGVLVDAVAPVVASIVRVDTATSNASSVQSSVTFSESVSGVDVADFVLTSAGTVAGTIASISGSGTTYTVTVNSITGDGTLRLDLASGNTGISDAAGNAIGSGFTGGEAYTFDHTVPSVISVSVPASGTYAAGESLDFTVNFDESITVDTTGGTPRLALTLDTGGTVYASYVSGSGTGALTFSYSLQGGELDSDGIDVGSLEANGGRLSDAVGNDADLTLNNISSTTGVLVDAVAPVVASIVRVDTATSNASSVQYTVTFSESVTGVDLADFVLTSAGTAAGTIVSISGSGTTDTVMLNSITAPGTTTSISGNGTTYTVTVNSITGDGTLRLDLASNGTGISDAAGNVIGSGFTAGEVYTFDHTAPSVTSVSVPANGSYIAGETLDFTVNFDESITVDTTGGTPRLALTLDTGGTVYASYVSGSGTGALTFSYTLQSGELDSDGISVGSLDANGGRLSDAVGNDADLTLNNISSTTGVLVDAVAPVVASIVRVDTATSNASSVQYTVTFSESVTGVDLADFVLTSAGTAAGTIASISGSGTTYTVTVNSITGDGTLRLDLASGNTGISDAAGNAIGSGFTGGEVYTFDHTAPSVTSVSVPANGSYIAGETLDFTVNFDESITVDTTGGTPRLALTLDTGGTVYASYVSGSGTAALTFSYTVMSGELDGDGISVDSLDSNGGTLRDSVGNDATTTLNGVGSTAAVLVDAVAPSVTSIVRVGAATTNASSVAYTVTFSEDVSGVDVSDFTLTPTGATTGTIASVTQINGSTYTVTVNSITGDGTLRLDASGAGITDVAGTSLAAGFTAGEAYTFDHSVPDTTGPAVVSVSVPSGDTYVAGDTLDFTVNFDESVIVDTTNGTPRLALTLDTGGLVYAIYVSGSGTTTLMFSYTVLNGQLDGDGIGVGSLDANGGTLRDDAGNDATLTLNGVGSTAGVLVDAVAPSVASIVRLGAPTTNASSVQYTVTFSENVTGVGIADFALTATGTAAGTIASISGGGTTYTVTVNNIAGDGTLRLDLSGSGTGIADVAANSIGGGFTSGDVYTFDHTPPSVISVGVPANTTYVAGQSLDFVVNFDEAVAVTTSGGTPRLALTLDTGGTVHASYVSGGNTAALTFRYIVSSGELDSDGISVGSLDLNGGTLRDFVGNDADLTLNGVGSTTAVLVDAVVPSVTSIARVGAATTNATSVQYTVTFSESVTGVDVADFSLAATGTAAGTIASITGSGTTYTVTINGITGDGTLRLDLNGASTGILDVPGTAISSGFTGGEVYTFDHTGPIVTSVSVPMAGTYRAGQSLELTVNFDVSISVDTVGGTPRLALTLDSGGTVYASYVSGSGTAALTFSYTVTSDQFDSDGIVVGNSIDANGGILHDEVGNPASLTLNGVGNVGAVLVDSVAPSVVSIATSGSSPSNATSAVYTVTFSEDVVGVDAADFSLTTTGTVTGTIASIAQVNGNTYTVSVTGISGDGTLRLDLNDSATGITDAAGTGLAGGFSGDSLSFDHSAPSILTVGVPPRGVYAAGDALDFLVSFDDAVTVDVSNGTPRVAILLAGGATVHADYVSGSDTTMLTFRYIVAANFDSDTLSVAGIDANGGTLRNAVGSDAVLALHGVAATSGISVDSVAPSIASITRLAAPLTNADRVVYTITFSEGVSGVFGGNFALVTTGTVTIRLAAAIQIGANTYRVTIDGITGDGTLRLDVNGIGITDHAGTALANGFIAADSYTFDHSAPSVIGIELPANGNYMPGQEVDFTVNFDERVMVDTTGGAPRIALMLDSGTAYASYVSGSGTAALTFRYVVDGLDVAPNGMRIASSIELNGATLTDAVGNLALLTLSNRESRSGIAVGRANVVISPPSPLPSAPANDQSSIVQLPSSSVLPPILNAFNGDGVSLSLGAMDSSAAPSSTGMLAGLAAGRENGPQDNGSRVTNASSPSTATSGFITMGENRDGGMTELRANAGLRTLTLPADQPIAFKLPADTFISNAGSRLAVEVTLSDGSPLPGWLRFDPRSGSFAGEPPAGEARTFSIQVIARDGNGQAAVVVFELEIGGNEKPNDEGDPATEPVSSTSGQPALDPVGAPLGKASLNLQFKAHGFNAWRQQIDTLVQHAREPASGEGSHLSRLSSNGERSRAHRQCS